MNNFQKQSSQLFPLHLAPAEIPSQAQLTESLAASNQRDQRNGRHRHSVTENISLFYHSYIKNTFKISGLKGGSKLPLKLNIVHEKKRMGPLFLELQTWKTSKSFMKLHQNNTAEWIRVCVFLCRDGLVCTLGLNKIQESKKSADLILEDIPLDLIAMIQYAQLRRQEDGRWTLELEQLHSDLQRWNRWFPGPGSKVAVSEGIETFQVEALPLSDPLLVRCNSCVKEQNRFLRLSVRCADLYDADLFSKSDPVCILSHSNNGGWQYISQTECIRDTQDPVFATRLEIDFPNPGDVLRFTIIDVDSESELCSNIKISEGGRNLLGIADLQAENLLAAVGRSITLPLLRRPNADPHDPNGGGGGTVTLEIEEVTALEAPCVLLLHARSDALHVARRHAFVFESNRARGQWAGNLRRAILQSRRDRRMERGVLLSLQGPVRDFYHSQAVQVASGLLVVANFIADATRAEAQGLDSAPFDRLDIVFASLFSFELALNMYGNWCRPFFQSGWNLFDLFTVVISLLSLFSSLNISSVRLFRAFRVMRLIKRITSLRLILNALIASLLPVSGALLILFLVMAVFAIIGTNTWGDHEPLLGSFSSALFTMFVVTTGDGWSDLARSLFADPAQPDPAVALFMVSYIVAAGWVLYNIVLAVLLEAFSDACAAERIAMQTARREAESSGGAGAALSTGQLLAPLLEALTAFGSREQLEAGIEDLWESIDVNGDGLISFPELCLELRRRGIAITLEDWRALVGEARRVARRGGHEGALGDGSNDTIETAAPGEYGENAVAVRDYTLDKLQFKGVILHSIQHYYQEGLVRAAENCTEADLSTLSVVNALKMVLLNQSAEARISGMVVEDHVSHLDSVDVLHEQTVSRSTAISSKHSCSLGPTAGTTPITSHRLLCEPPPTQMNQLKVDPDPKQETGRDKFPDPNSIPKQETGRANLSNSHPSDLPGFCESSTHDTVQDTAGGGGSNIHHHSDSEELSLARCKIAALEAERMRMLNLDVRCRVLENELQRCQARLAECEATSEGLRAQLQIRTRAVEEAELVTRTGEAVPFEATRLPSAAGQLVAADDFCSYLNDSLLPNQRNS